ncbi:UDP-N-acetylglucosamine transferase subunit ALG13 [Rhizobium sp. BK650]|uniref:glycosyltransferase n=1 Tax=Rhizobium sp. BK650 TaxID=2586990 RepID=UPI0016140202|nr:glycosyltransferase [Rhizobium sp. BK650]MBB3659244.1 UDP-N-acetylglucosamine transferase subunit ALG13 [Rhizobium sp. BK650]
MIVVTVGTQLPFDRLIMMIDEIAPSLSEEVFSQIGAGHFKPVNHSWSANVEASEFDQKLRSCSLIVSHAGIGTVLKAYAYRKPIILVPRLSSFGEHRNDHQLATVGALKERPGIYIAESKAQLNDLLLAGDLKPALASNEIERSKRRLQSYLREAVLEALQS